jgi:hypothetical protein
MIFKAVRQKLLALKYAALQHRFHCRGSGLGKTHRARIKRDILPVGFAAGGIRYIFFPI